MICTSRPQKRTAATTVKWEDAGAASSKGQIADDVLTAPPPESQIATCSRQYERREALHSNSKASLW
jgi:hypothetical protein